MLTDDDRFELETRIETARSSVRRTRLAFLALNLASLALLLLVWNCYFSWSRFLIPAKIDPNAEFLKAEIARNWVRSLFTSTGSLGVTVGVADASLVGSVILLVLTVWFYFSARRENHTAARLLENALTYQSPSVRRAVFWAIADEHIFLNWAKIDKPFGAILPLRTASGDTPLVEQPDRVVRGALSLLMYLPFYTVAVAWSMDIYSLTQPSLFREAGRPLYTQLSAPEWIQVTAIVVVAAGLALVLRNLLVKIADFNTDTVQQLRDFASKVEEIPDPPVEQPKKSGLRRVPPVPGRRAS